jgi:cholesterol oxidase
MIYTEKIWGWFAFADRDSRMGFEHGRAAGSSIMFRLTITTDDVYRFIEDRNHTADAQGWIDSDALGGRLQVEHGTFNLFVDEGPASREMRYRLFFSDGVGRPLTLSGLKYIRAKRRTAVWSETSTLYAKLLTGHIPEGEEKPAALAGSGILRILPTDFAWELTTFRVHGPNASADLAALAAFGRFFVGQLWEVYEPRRLN